MTVNPHVVLLIMLCGRHTLHGLSPASMDVSQHEASREPGQKLVKTRRLFCCGSARARVMMPPWHS